MKHDLEHQITESLRLYEQITGRRIRRLRWSHETRSVTVVVGRPGARVEDPKDFDLNGKAFS